MLLLTKLMVLVVLLNQVLHVLILTMAKTIILTAVFLTGEVSIVIPVQAMSWLKGIVYPRIRLVLTGTCALMVVLMVSVVQAHAPMAVKPLG